MKYALVMLMLLAGCSQPEDASQADSTASADSIGSGDMTSMPGMGAAGTTTMIQDMRATLKRMADAPQDSIAAMVPDHRRNAANLLAEMNREMAGMQMGVDAAWTAVSDSVREDLVRLSEVNAEQAKAIMADHGRRVERLIVMHEEMMKH